MPLQSEVVTQFNPSVTGSFTLGRKYEVNTLENIISRVGEIEKFQAQETAFDYVVVIEDVPISNQERNQNYTVSQFGFDKSPTTGLIDLLKEAIK